MSIFIDNTLTGKKEEFIPLNPPQVKMYVCGPTVYDEPHIGHARSAYIFDVIRRYLKYRGYEVTFVRNVTDVDDKIINKAKEKYPGENLKSAVKKVSEEYLKAYHDAMKLLGIDPPDKEPKATEYLTRENPMMQKFIEDLIKRGIAYVSEGDVYFDIKKAQGYGKLSHQSLSEMEVGARIAPGEKKRDPLDFVLWKAAKEGEPSWESTWGDGRPGWHIECSVMSSEILGDEFDIHGGGLDLKFPHHENEIAQSEGAGKKFARCWIHHGLLTINGQKMAKSLGNFITIKKFKDEHPYIDSLKVLFLNTHYSNPIDYTEENIKEADSRLSDIALLMGEIDLRLSNKENELKSREINELKEIRNRFITAMDDNFHTPGALAAISELVGITKTHLDDLEFIAEARKLWEEFAKIFGLDYKRKDIIVKVDTLRLSSQSLAPNVFDITKEVKELVLKRDDARKRKDFKEADTLKIEIEKKGYIVEDGKGESRLRKKS